MMKQLEALKELPEALRGVQDVANLLLEIRNELHELNTNLKETLLVIHDDKR